MLFVGQQEISSKTSTASALARAVFLIYLFFSFFGTSKLPFREEINDVADIQTSSVINQIVFSTLYFLAALSLFSKRKELAALLKKEKYLALFLLWCLVSVLWSESPLVSLKRWMQVLGATMVCAAILLHVDSTDEALRYFKKILALYIPLSLLAIIFYPAGAIQWKFPAWRGVAPHKNTLGQISMISSMVWFFAMRRSSLAGKFFCFLLLVTSVILLFGAKSTTSLFVLLCLLGLGTFLLIDRILGTLGIGRTFSWLVMLAVAGLALTVHYFEPRLSETFLNLFGKDSSFSGRTEIWAFMFNEVKSHLFLGCGFEGFWVVGNKGYMALQEEITGVPDHAHLGYLDLLNETGVIGIFLLLVMIFSYFKNLARLDKPHFWKWFFLAALLINLQESTLFRLNALSGVLFTFSYLALHRELMKQSKPVTPAVS